MSAATRLLIWAILVLGLGGTVVSSRAATQVPLELRDISEKDKPSVMQERAWRLQKEQAAAALMADRHQKAFRQIVMAGVNARAQQRAAEISRQLASTEVTTQPASGSSTALLFGIVLVIAGIICFRWHRRRQAG